MNKEWLKNLKVRLRKTKSYTFKAATLYYALMISLLIGMISSSIILSRYLVSKENLQQQKKLHLNHLVDQGFEYLKGTNYSFQDDSNRLQIFTEQTDTLIHKSKLWGLYSVHTLLAKDGRLRSEKTAMFGASDWKHDELSLFLTNQNKPLSIAGNTRIAGDATIPKAGIKRAIIDGNSYTGSELVYGQTSNSPNKIPTINEKFVGSTEGRT